MPIRFPNILNIYKKFQHTNLQSKFSNEYFSGLDDKNNLFKQELFVNEIIGTRIFLLLEKLIINY